MAEASISGRVRPRALGCAPELVPSRALRVPRHRPESRPQSLVGRDADGRSVLREDRLPGRLRRRTGGPRLRHLGRKTEVREDAPHHGRVLNSAGTTGGTARSGRSLARGVGMVSRIDHLGLYVADIEAVVRFWHDVVGLDCAGIEDHLETGQRARLHRGQWAFGAGFPVRAAARYRKLALAQGWSVANVREGGWRGRRSCRSREVVSVQRRLRNERGCPSLLSHPSGLTPFRPSPSLCPWTAANASRLTPANAAGNPAFAGCVSPSTTYWTTLRPE